MRGLESGVGAALDLHHTVMPQTPRASTPTEVLAGLVERITFHNEENASRGFPRVGWRLV